MSHALLPYEVYEDRHGNTAERVRYTLPLRDVLVVRAPARAGQTWRDAPLLGDGGRDDRDIPVGSRTLAADLARIGVDVATLRPRVFDTKPSTA